MNRTDLCQEAVERLESWPKGIEKEEYIINETTLTRLIIHTSHAAKQIGKPEGCYITATLPHFAHESGVSEATLEALTKELKNLLPKEGPILVVGAGNRQITPDAYGPFTAEQVLATRHIPMDIGFRSVTVISPGVMAQTGLELAELVQMMTKQLKPACVIVVDALAAASPARLGCTWQLCDQGIAPGSGVLNNRKTISPQSLGVPVVGIGVPTVIDASPFLSHDNHLDRWPAENLMITPRDVDLMVRRAAGLTATVINCALHPGLTPQEAQQLLA